MFAPVNDIAQCTVISHTRDTQSGIFLTHVLLSNLADLLQSLSAVLFSRCATYHNDNVLVPGPGGPRYKYLSSSSSVVATL